jgi:hypothetical protein
MITKRIARSVERWCDEMDKIRRDDPVSGWGKDVMPNTANTEVAARQAALRILHNLSAYLEISYLTNDNVAVNRVASFVATALAAAEAKGDKAGFERAREAAAGVALTWEDERHVNPARYIAAAIRSLSVEPPASVEGEK